MCAHCVLPLCAFIVRFIVRAMGVVRRHSMHNGAQPSRRNEAAQCKIIVRPAWHNGRAHIGEAKSAWHNVFVIVRFFFDSFLLITYSSFNAQIWVAVRSESWPLSGSRLLFHLHSLSVVRCGGWCWVHAGRGLWGVGTVIKLYSPISAKLRLWPPMSVFWTLLFCWCLFSFWFVFFVLFPVPLAGPEYRYKLIVRARM